MDFGASGRKQVTIEYKIVLHLQWQLLCRFSDAGHDEAIHACGGRRPKARTARWRNCPRCAGRFSDAGRRSA